MKKYKAKKQYHPKIQADFVKVPDKLTSAQKKAVARLTKDMEVEP